MVEMEILSFFGQVKPGYPQSKAITIKSIGTEQVFYQTNQMINNGNNTFSYEKSIDGPGSYYYTT